MMRNQPLESLRATCSDVPFLDLFRDEAYAVLTHPENTLGVAADFGVVLLEDVGAY